MKPPGSTAARARRVNAKALAALLLGLAAAAAVPGAGAQTTSPSPSDPPAWARPRQAPPPNCDCEGVAAAAAPARSGRPSALTGGLLVGGVLLTLFLVWRRLQRPPGETYVRPTPAPAPTPVAPPPPSDGIDPRARLRQPHAAPERAAAPPPDDLMLADPRAMSVELAQDEPDSETAGAQAFYAEIAASLVAALYKEPERQDLRRKLLEIYFAARQTNEFVTLAHEYLEHNRGSQDKFWPDIGAMGARLAPDHELFADWADGKRGRAVVRHSSQQRRFHERSIDPGRMYTAQQSLVTDFERLRKDPGFRTSLRQLLADAARRPAPLAASPELTYVADGAQIFIKHEDRRRFHDDDMINAIGQILVAQRLGRTRVVTATLNGMHGHAVAGAAAKLGMECHIYITERDLNRHYARVLSMRRLGANIRPIPNSIDEVADPRRNALDAWLDDPATTQYVSGLTAGPAPFPEMARDFLSIVGHETLEQMQQLAGGPPSIVIAGVADGHLGLGLLQGLLDQPAIQLHCVEDKVVVPPLIPVEGDSPLEQAPRGSPTRREHGWLRDTRRVTYVAGDDQETLRVIEQYHATGTTLYTQSARTLAYARALARRRERKDTIVVLLTGQEGADFRSLGSDW